MSGLIWGIINLKNKSITKEKNSIIMKSIQNEKIDKYKYVQTGNILFGCGIQYLTKESLDEILPYEDKENCLIITADAVIDNRAEILEELGLSKNKESDFSDSQYILMSYKKWGKDCVKYLLGDFSFAIWDELKKELFCARDQIGRRTFYYYFDDEIFTFCTLINPIVNIINSKVKLNERWIADFLALQNGEEVIEDEETIYKDMLQLQAAHIAVVDKEGKITKEKYWDPFKDIKILSLSSEKEYIERFMNIYIKAVKCRLRGIKDIGLMLSGGLDSSSIAALASRLLKEEGRKLKTYTSVPLEEFKRDDTKTLTFNEKKDVEKIKQFVGNMETNFCDFRGKNSIDNIDEMIKIYEEPYKVMESTYYINGITEKAAEDNCTVLLTGQYGNVTISQGDFFTEAITLIRRKKFISLIKEIDSVHNTFKVGRKKLAKTFISSALPYKFKLKRFYKKNPDYDRFENSPINKNLIQAWDVENRFNKNLLNIPVDIVYDFEESKQLTVDKNINSRVCMVAQKLGLKHGLIIRDPTADVRVIEFCLSIPMNMYIDEKMDRKLIRLSMNNLLPDSIIMIMNKIGIQSSDWIERIESVWNNKTYDDIFNIINDSRMNKFINVNKLNAILENLKVGISRDKEKEIITLLEALIISKFLNKYYGS